MKVLDASFLIDYEHGVEATAEYLLAHEDEEFVVPSTIYGEYLLGAVHSTGETDLPGARNELNWATIHPVDRRTVDLALEAADEVGPQGPNLSATDMIPVGVARETGGAVVSSDGDHTHPAVRAVVDVEEYA